MCDVIFLSVNPFILACLSVYLPHSCLLMKVSDTVFLLYYPNHYSFLTTVVRYRIIACRSMSSYIKVGQTVIDSKPYALIFGCLVTDWVKRSCGCIHNIVSILFCACRSPVVGVEECLPCGQVGRNVLRF